jgi:hypothetical protein
MKKFILIGLLILVLSSVGFCENKTNPFIGQWKANCDWFSNYDSVEFSVTADDIIKGRIIVHAFDSDNHNKEVIDEVSIVGMCTPEGVISFTGKCFDIEYLLMGHFASEDHRLKIELQAITEDDYKNNNESKKMDVVFKDLKMVTYRDI